MPKKVYILEHLGCANCAAKIEKEILTLPGIEEAVITFSTKQLRLSAEDPDSYLPRIEKIARSYEPEITITERKRKGSAVSVHKHRSLPPETDSCRCDSHGEVCRCGDSHDHSGHCCDHSEDTSSHCQDAAPSLIKKLTGSDLFFICSGALFYVIALLMPSDSFFSIGIFLLSYLILGWRILKTAGTNILSGQIFDENFLMSLATIGAFLIQEYPEAAGIMLFYRIGEYFENRAVLKSRNSIMEAIDLRPETVTILKNNGSERIPAENARPGDVVLLRAGDRIPLDGTILEGTTRIDTSAVTGEPVPVAAGPGDSVFSGCINQSGTIRLRVEKPLEESMVSRILDAVETAASNKPKMERFITRFSRVYTPIVTAIAAITAVIPSLITGDFHYWIYTALTFLVISCPCALVLSVPLAFFSGIGAGSSKGILFKGGLSLEAAKNITTVIMDKTGTITKGTFEVQQILPYHSSVTEEELLSLCGSCEESSSHPIAGSILSALKQRNLSFPSAEFVEEQAGKGIHAIISDDHIYCGSLSFMKEAGVSLPDTRLPLSGTVIFLARNTTFLGSILLDDEIKSDSAKAVTRLHNMGLHTVMLTGDGEESALAVCEKTGVESYYARLLPEEKLTVLHKIREKNGAVMFVGDGINDAPVLAGADVGAAMGDGADAAIEAADLVFMNKNLMSVADSIEIARAVSGTAAANIIFALIIKAFVLILGFFQAANIWFAVFADTGVALLCVLNSIRVLYRYK